jgi:ubiquinone/menaquinone biosynthesis C-methylase UbiE
MGGQVYFAPVIDPQQILDIGTGTGIWAIDAGEEYPGATGTFSLFLASQIELELMLRQSRQLI